LVDERLEMNASVVVDVVMVALVRTDVVAARELTPTKPVKIAVLLKRL
jgi:hypothetical protein